VRYVCRGNTASRCIPGVVMHGKVDLFMVSDVVLLDSGTIVEDFGKSIL
jgi:hypothetical protein